jgi:hypothetical protein
VVTCVQVEASGFELRIAALRGDEVAATAHVGYVNASARQRRGTLLPRGLRRQLVRQLPETGEEGTAEPESSRLLASDVVLTRLCTQPGASALDPCPCRPGLAGLRAGRRQTVVPRRRISLRAHRRP